MNTKTSNKQHAPEWPPLTLLPKPFFPSSPTRPPTTPVLQYGAGNEEKTTIDLADKEVVVGQGKKKARY